MVKKIEMKGFWLSPTPIFSNPKPIIIDYTYEDRIGDEHKVTGVVIEPFLYHENLYNAQSIESEIIRHSWKDLGIEPGPEHNNFFGRFKKKWDDREKMSGVEQVKWISERSQKIAEGKPRE
jgi:hypothetical protein